jgi:hypothetical protein
MMFGSLLVGIICPYCFEAVERNARGSVSH